MNVLELMGIILILFGLIYILLRGYGKISDSDANLEMKILKLKGGTGLIVMAFGFILLILGSGLIPLDSFLLTTPQTITPIPTSSPSQSVLTVHIWDVQQDQKHSIITSQSFEIPADISIADETLKEVGHWVTEQIEKEYGLVDIDVQVQVYIPADLSQENLDIQMTPQGSYGVYYSYVLDERGKIRVHYIDKNSLKNLGKDFSLHIKRPGYSTETLTVKWGNMLYKNFTLQPKKVSIGIEEFTGENNSVATWLMNYLIQNPRFTIKDPSTLDRLREEIEEEKFFIAENPSIQEDIITSLGVDLIISGHYEKN